MRVNRGQELAIGRFVSAPKNFHSIVVGHCEGKQLLYIARVRNGFTAGVQRSVALQRGTRAQYVRMPSSLRTCSSGEHLVRISDVQCCDGY